MPPKAPKFWSRKGHLLAALLTPLGWLYGLGVRASFAFTSPYRSKLPVICIGNYTLGGGGKTPLAMQIGQLLKEQDHKPVFLTRGYGGQEKGPHLVDEAKDSAVYVGDEPLLLAQVAPVVVCADRRAGARFIEQMDEADVIVMDDGFQNPSLHKDLSFIAVDAARGFGNGRIFPAGPLRASMKFQQGQTDAVFINGTLATAMKEWGAEMTGFEELFSLKKENLFETRIVARDDASWLDGTQVSAFAGIADPLKFRATLQQYGAQVEVMYEFADHYPLGEVQANDILQEALHLQLDHIVTTAKDWARLPQTGARGELRRMTRVLDIKLEFEQSEKLVDLLEKTISSFASQCDD